MRFDKHPQNVSIGGRETHSNIINVNHMINKVIDILKICGKINKNDVNKMVNKNAEERLCSTKQDYRIMSGM